MKRMKRIHCSALTLLAVLGVPATGAAYNVLMCENSPFGVELGISSPIRFALNRCSIPEGSVAETDVLKTMRAWNSIRGVWDPFLPPVSGSTSCTISHVDNQNDIALVPSSNPWLSGGALGTTIYRGRVTGTCQELSWDILIDNSLPGGASHDLDQNPTRRGALVHELGHVMGLGHMSLLFGGDQMSIMAPGIGENATTGPYGGRSASGGLGDDQMHAPHADDVRFALDYFGSGLTSNDVATNAWARSGVYNFLATPPVFVPVCDGTQFPDASFTWHNRGTGTVDSDWEMVMSTNEVISTYDRKVTGGGAGGSSGWSQRGSFTFTIPEDLGTAQGILYQVGVVADPDFNMSEQIETNNATRLPIVLWVFDC